MVEAALAIIQNPIRTDADVTTLAGLLNQLMLHDFEQLVQLLYRVDVPEQEVRSLLRQQPSVDAGRLLALLLLNRASEKETARKQYLQPNHNIPDEERW